MKIQDFKKIKFPKNPGVYFFKKGKSILYIGKATSLRDRVKSYFGKDPEGKNTSYGASLIVARGLLIVKMVEEATLIKWQETDSVLEAVILEANLIKKYQPKYNTKEKDNKSFNYVCITDEEIPKVLVKRGRNLFGVQMEQEGAFLNRRCGRAGARNERRGISDFKKHFPAELLYKNIFGPFPNGLQLREAMKIIRRIFPYIDEQSNKKNNREFYKQLGLIPNIIVSGGGRKKSSFPSWSGSSSSLIRGPEEKKLFSDRQNEYKKNIKNLKLFFEGKKKSVITNLKKEMLAFAKKKEFEKAGVIKKRIFALNHINDVALIKEDASQNYENFRRFTQIIGAYTDKNFHSFVTQKFRIEAYDIAHMSGKSMVGAMVVMEEGELAKNEYRKFIINTQSNANDTGALEEVLSRRLRHTEWGLPNVIVMDGGIAQINIAKAVLNRYQFKISVVAVVKDDKHKAKAIMGDEAIIKKYKKEILLINSESHRFAITFHKKRRNKDFLKMEEME